MEGADVADVGSRNTGLILLAVFAGLTGFVARAEQQPAATFTSEVGVVEINAVVTDANGTFIRGLAKDDFQIYEDGRPRPFAFFSLVDMPVSSARAASGAPERDVRTLTESRNGRVYVLVFDDLHIAPLRTALLKAAARRFVEQYFYAGDLAAIVRTGPGQPAGQELTNSRRLLLAAIDRFQGQQIDSAADGRLDTARRQLGSLDDTAGERLDDPNDAERSFNARSTLNALCDTARWMDGIHGRRKSLIFFQ